MIDKEIIYECLKEIGFVRKSGRHYVGRCYSCGKEDKFYINWKTGLFDCKSVHCDLQSGGNIFTFLKGIGKPHLIQGKQIEDVEQIKSKLITDINDEHFLDLSLVKDVKLPVGSYLLDYDDIKNDNVDYLINERKLTREDFEMYQPHHTNVIEKYEEYVLFPVYQFYEIKGFFGRYNKNKEHQFYDADKKRYENNKGAKFSQLIYGYDEITSKTTTLIPVEGGFDKIAVSRKLNLHTSDEVKCICTFGKKISDFQLQLIKQTTNVENLLFMYDTRDAVNEIKKSGLKSKEFFNVEACELPDGKDPDLMTTKELLYSINNSLPIEKFCTDRVQMNFLK